MKFRRLHGWCMYAHYHGPHAMVIYHNLNTPQNVFTASSLKLKKLIFGYRIRTPCFRPAPLNTSANSYNLARKLTKQLFLMRLDIGPGQPQGHALLGDLAAPYTISSSSSPFLARYVFSTTSRSLAK